MTATLADVIKARRLVRGLEREDLARAVGCDARSVLRWEAGAQPCARHMLRLREVLDIPIDLMDELVLAMVSEADPRPRIVGAAELPRLGWDLRRALAEMLALDQRTLAIEGTRHEGTVEGWLPVLEALPESWRLLVQGGAVVGNWHIVPLTPAAAERMRAGQLYDCQITLPDVETLDLPGRCDLLICAFVLDPAARTPETFRLLFDSLIDAIGRLAAREVFADRLLAATWTPASQLLCRRLGFEEVAALVEGDRRIPVVEARTAEVLALPEMRRFERLRGLYEAGVRRVGRAGPRLVAARNGEVG
jgi:transcriptional regulator with XRE-family HTH domain